MNKRNRLAKSMLLVLLLLLLISSITLLLWPSGQDAQQPNPLKSGTGWQTNGQQQYALPQRTNTIEFPRAHMPHKNYRHEWWYLTANLTNQQGQVFAAQWTLFRTIINDRHLYFAHAALADETQHRFATRNAREELGNVTIEQQPFSAIIDDWSWQSSAQLLPARLLFGSAQGAMAKASPFPQKTLPSLTLNTPTSNDLHAQQNDWQVALALSSSASSSAPFYLQGFKGFNKKHKVENVASHYYSQPFIDVVGDILWQGKRQQVSGIAWFDREWGSALLAQDQIGWDWFSLHLSKDLALMVYRIRSTGQDFVYASLMHAKGAIETLKAEDIAIKSHTNKQDTYPDSFTLEIAKRQISLNISVVNTKQIINFRTRYFEGMVKFSGSYNGVGFVEMTGYD